MQELIIVPIILELTDDCMCSLSIPLRETVDEESTPVAKTIGSSVWKIVWQRDPTTSIHKGFDVIEQIHVNVEHCSPAKQGIHVGSEGTLRGKITPNAGLGTYLDLGTTNKIISVGLEGCGTKHAVVTSYETKLTPPPFWLQPHILY